jgi:hypothetical protein
MDYIEERLRKHAIETQSLSAMYAEKARMATEEYQQYKIKQTNDDSIQNVSHTKGTRTRRKSLIRLKYTRV